LADECRRYRRHRPLIERCPRLGQWAALATLAGALWGYPVLLWLDPLALLSGVFGPLPAGPGLLPWLALAGLPLVLLVSLLWPGVWCGRLCPLGGLQEFLFDVLAALRRRLSPRAPVLESGTAAAARAASAADHRLPRRGALAAAAGLAAAAYATRCATAADRPLRPPGAAAEARFRGLCIRCGNCGRACPAQIIAPDYGGRGLASLLTPVLSFAADHCRADCVRCTQVCPSGALTPMPPGAKPRAALGLPKVDPDACLLADGHECAICQIACPYAAIQRKWDEDTYTNMPVVDRQRCNGCGACQVACPTQPVKAIIVFPLQDAPQPLPERGRP